MARKKRALFMTVGTGFKDNQKSLAHGLMCSIVSKDPDLICFFGSRKSKSTIDTLKQIFNESNDEDFDDYFETKFIENDNIDEFKDYFFEFKSKILELENDYKIIIDYTSGTKTMTMSAAFASMIFGKELFLVAGDRKDGVVVKGTEKCISQNLYPIYDELIMDKIKDLFNSNRFEAGKLLIDDMISTNENKVIYSKLFNTYYYFDNVNYKKALENFDLKIFKETWPELAIDFQKNIIALNILNKQNQDSNDKTRFVDHKQKKYYMLASIINNSKRRGKENKFDDAVARLYRSFELIAQIRLLEKYNIDSSNVDIDILKEYGLADDYLDELENSRDKKYNDIKLGLIKDYVLLEQLNDDLGKFYLENENKIRNIIKFRNNSILAHGFEFCSKEDFEEFKEIVLKAADLLNKNMGRFIEETKFPMFS